MKDPQIHDVVSLSINQATLDSFNVEQAKGDNKANLDAQGGPEGLAKALKLNIETGLTAPQVLEHRQLFGDNTFPETPMDSYLSLLLKALSDTTLLILIAAASVSLGVGIYHEGAEHGWIEGGAIFIAVFLVANISAGNDYTKQLQFKALESTSAKDERCSVFRDSNIDRINPKDLVVGDIVIFQAGDQVPADCIMIDNNIVKSNESSLTGEPDDLKKSKADDCFLLSSCLLTEGEEVRAVVIGIGLHSQWGKIKANLVTEAVNTPLQDKLEEMTTRIGYIGMGFALGTFVALIASIWLRNNGNDIAGGFINAFILAVTIVVVAIPEGLPLAVTISLAYSTKKMYKDQCFIRVLAACETMGNATNICSDKTGTLTENRMTVVEGWFGDVKYEQDTFGKKDFMMPEHVRRVVGEQVCINRTAYLITKSEDGKVLDRPSVIGNKTEGALIIMCQGWGMDYEEVRKTVFNETTDRIFSFNSGKKRSTAVVHRPDGSVRIYCKGATEWVLRDCNTYLSKTGAQLPMTSEKKEELEAVILNMAQNALRTLLLAHKDYASPAHLPANWMEDPPDNTELCCDCIVGIIDPLRDDVKDAVAIAQRAGVIVRMVTGDNIATASAIAKQCGILTKGGMAVEGPIFRKMAPADVDKIIPTLQVMARSSPDDKYLLVTRLNGYGIPNGKEEWQEKFRGRTDITWENDRDKVLPGHKEEWLKTRPEGGEVVGVTGDGTNDAPALKAADVGLSMGITGTKVAQGASDIVILDDRFGSIVKAIMWGRAVYDAIRKFLQFQLTVNVVALILVFIGAVAGFGQPLNAVQMLWVNLVMDTMGALALGTEPPTMALLDRKPYKRSASLISRPMVRNIICQALWQLAMLFTLMFEGPRLFNIKATTLTSDVCARYHVKTTSTKFWNVETKKVDSDALFGVGCSDFRKFCSGGEDAKREDRNSQYCLEDKVISLGNGLPSFVFGDLEGFTEECLDCAKNDYTHGSLLFNSFIWCQIFNEYSSRNLEDDVNMFRGIFENSTFIIVSIISIGAQIFLIEIGGEFVKTSHLNISQWLISIGLGAVTLVVGALMRFIPVTENPDSFFSHEAVSEKAVVETA